MQRLVLEDVLFLDHLRQLFENAASGAAASVSTHSSSRGSSATSSSLKSQTSEESVSSVEKAASTSSLFGFVLPPVFSR